ncbi:MAG TPA: hypothetical protein VMQ76_03550 [Terracidiphilus sp.]|nr:hypothetical protein [Terracidiphilus sp.]
MGITPPSYLWDPKRISMWGNDQYGDCTVAEEAFAKSVAAGVFVPDAEVIQWARTNGAIDGDTLIDVLDKMQTGGFALGGKMYDDGEPRSIDWTNAAILKNAICQGPVKIGIAADQLQEVVPNPPTNGWIATGFAQDDNMDHCVSLCGYGSMAWLSSQLGAPEPMMPLAEQTQAYAMFSWDSVGIIDVPSLIAICGEAWIRVPNSVIK